MRRIILIILVILPGLRAFAQTDSTANTLFDLSLEDLLNLDLVDRNFYLYGYINSNFQKTFDVPFSNPDGEIRKESDPGEWIPVKNFHLYGQANLSDRVSFLFNIALNDGESLEIRNAWGNFMIKEPIQVRVGKMYRKFGLYNERLDQIPTFIGIEAPEMLDQDHLFLTRTTNFMVHGALKNARREISYALMTDNGEGGPARGLFPVGWDLRLKSYTNSFIIGTSGYTSSVNDTYATSTIAPRSGSPTGGILPWMDAGKFTVAGVFLEKKLGNVIIQSEYYTSKHKSIRNADATLQIIRDAGINTFQRNRFLGANAEKNNEMLQETDIIRDVNYTVQTWYVRAGYNLNTSIGQMVPYLFVDWMSHPENIRNKQFGGDDEAGLADDGTFWKPSIGIVYRPLPAVAIKLDGSYHSQKINNRQVTYPELRIDFSFAFSNAQLEKALRN